MDVAALPFERPSGLAPGERLGPYEIRGVLGSGGIGTVYRARDDRLGREVAVKVLADGGERSAATLPQLEHEARLLAALSHPNILGIFDFGEENGRRYVVTELLAGVNLRERMDGHPLPWRTAVAIALEVSKGLAAAHAASIVHLDLKPENIFVLAQGGVKILDFGLARREAPREALVEPAAAPPKEGKRIVFGTLGYLAPEQIAGAPVDHRSDLFALGGVMYEMLSGREPFKRDTLVGTLDAITNREPPSIASSGRTVPDGLARVVRRCLKKDPADRFQSAYDLAFELAELLAQPPAPAPPPLDWRARVGWFLAGFVAALLAVVLLLLT